METLRDFLTTRARCFGRNISLEFGEQQYSYEALDDRTDHVATGLHRMGVRPGDKVALLLSNRPEFIFFFLGAPKLGYVPVPLNPNDSCEDIAFILDHCEASAVITEKSFADLRPRIPNTTCWIEVDDASFEKPPFQKLSQGPVLSFWPDLSPDDPALIAYTRTAAGLLKPVVLTHANLLSNSFQMIRPFRVNETDRFLCTAPLCSLEAEVLLVLAPLAAGACCVFGEADASRTIPDIRKQRATVITGTPQFFEQISKSDAFTGTDLSSLRLAICHSGPVGKETLEAFKDLHDAIIVEVYNRAEATCIVCANPYTGVRKPGSLGIPLPGLECGVVDAEGRELPPGAGGEIVVRGSNVMKEYYKDPDGTRRVLRDGWFHTGESGCIDPDGYYWRIADSISEVRA